MSDSRNPMKDAEVELVDSREVMDATANSMMEATAEIVLAISPMRIIVEMEENLPRGMTESTEVAGPLCSVEGVEVVES